MAKNQSWWFATMVRSSRTSYPSRGVRADPLGNMGEVCGVAGSDDAGQRYVINLYHSNP
jgi:hypothetical protein